MGPKAVGNQRHGYGPIFRNKIIGLLVDLLLTRKDLKIRLETSILIEEWTCGVGVFIKLLYLDMTVMSKLRMSY